VKPILVSQKDFATIVQVDARTVRNWRVEGLPIVKRRGGVRGTQVIDLVVAFRWLLKRNAAMHAEALAALRSTPELDDLRRRKLTAEMRLAEVTLAEREAELIPAAAVEPRWARMALAMRERILALPAVAVQRGAVAPEHEGQIADLAHDALAELATQGQEAAT